jgi:cytochrome c oxidase subunit 2
LAPLLVAGLALGGCSGIQSALDPAGHEARSVAGLFFVMAIGAGIVWAVVMSVAVYATRISSGGLDERMAKRLILWGGVAFPTIVLAALLIYGLRLMPVLREPGEGLTIAVTGEQFWWRVTYQPKEGPPVRSANEVRVPVGERVEFALTSPDVIHAFWIPSLGGKVDMIPGRENRLVLKAEKAGTYRGVCAEFCGASHALMAFPVIAMEKPDFEAWLSGQSRPAAEPVETAKGKALFLSNGCGACHTVSGTAARGEIGPDLTRFGERATIAAGTLPNEPEQIARFIRETDAVKPWVRMPAYPALPREDLMAIAGYLGSLK